MAASLVIEDERGTYTRIVRHPHNGYYAGDFDSASCAPASTARVGLRSASEQPAWGW